MSAKNPPSVNPAEGEESIAYVEAVVARGRSVLDGTGERKLAGESVRIAESEVKSLLALGFIVDPKAKPVPVQQGPKITASDGPGVKRLA